MQKLIVLISIICLLQSCFTTSPYPSPTSKNPTYVQAYSPFLEKGSTLVGAGFHWMRERTADGATILKQFYPSKLQITHFITIRNGMKSGRYTEWYDNGNKWKEGTYGNNLRTGEWKNYSYPLGYLSEYGNYRMGKKEGVWTNLDSLGNKERIITYSKGERHGVYKIWSKAGELKEEGRYENGEKVESKKYETVKQEEEIFNIVEEMPYVKGDCMNIATYEERKKCGERALTMHLYQNLRYPAIARENGLEGMALVQFTIEKDGSVTDINFMRGLCKEIEATCLNVVESMPEWQPGIQAEKNVRVRFTLPIKFKLQ
ncbi:MAG: TonB family protein [Bacteroidota bacterium]